MKHLSLVIVASLIITLFSCQKEILVPSIDSNVEVGNDDQRQDFIYDVVVTFHSAGAGINIPIKDQIMQEIEASSLAFGVNINYQVFTFAREGERDMCFDLTNLSITQKDAFLLNIKTITLNAQLVDTVENIERPSRG